MITQERLKQVLHYDLQTGVFTWKVAPPRKPFLLGNAAGFDVNGYIGICVDRKKYPAHHLAWLYMTGTWPADEIDHRDRVKSNNRWGNLREATHPQNTRNAPLTVRNRSGKVGVCWDPVNSKWRAHITVNGKLLCQGRFDDKEAAISARRTAEQRYFGEFASAA